MPLHTGNTNDDDGAVIDSFLVERDNPPETVPSIPPTEVPSSKRARPENTRILGGYVTLAETNVGNIPFPIPVDTDRFNVSVAAISSVATDGVSISSDPASLQVGGGTIPGLSGRIIPAHGYVPLNEHNGPIFAVAWGSSAPVVLTWLAVTK